MRRSIAWLVVLVLVTLPLAAQEKPINPETLWSALMTGNKEFVSGKIVYDQLKEERKEFSLHQYPPMTILSCSDSRVPPELVFNQSLGSLFVVRSAGNVADTFGVASIEYAIAQGYTMLIVVLGHSSCGAVEASLGAADPGTPSLLALATRIRMSFVGIKWDPKDPEIMKKAVEANARASAAALLAESRVIRDAVMSGKVKVVAAYYDLATGEVKKLD
jgi:carbonic anhydrase